MSLKKASQSSFKEICDKSGTGPGQVRDECSTPNQSAIAPTSTGSSLLGDDGFDRGDISVRIFVVDDDPFVVAKV